MACAAVAQDPLSPQQLGSNHQDIARLYSNTCLLQIKQLVCGGVAGCVAKTVVAPLSRVTVLMQVQSMRPHKFRDGASPNNQHLVASLRKICCEEGVTALWRGNSATLAHRFPYGAVTFYANTLARDALDKEPWSNSVHHRARSLVAGGISASIGVLSCYPLDVVKTRLITQTSRFYYTGIGDALSKIYRDEGRRGLYRGLCVSMSSVVPSLALNFALFEDFHELYAPLGLQSSLHSLLAGGSSGAISSTILFPLDLTRRQMQMVGFGGRPQVYSGALQAMSHIYETGVRRQPMGSRWVTGVFFGFREFFRGLVPELLKVAPHSAAMFCVHRELMSRRWFFEHEDANLAGRMKTSSST